MSEQIRETCKVNDYRNDKVGDETVKRRKVAQFAAACRKKSHVDCSENYAHGVAACKKCDGYAVEAFARQTHVGVPIKLCVAVEVVQRRACACQCACNRHRQHDVTLVVHACVFCGVTVGAACLKFETECRLVENDKDYNSKQNRNDNAAVSPRPGENLVHKQPGGGHVVVESVVQVARLALVTVDKLRAGKYPTYKVGGYPVGHYAHYYFVYAKQCLKQPGYRTPQRACQHAAKQSQKPHAKSA